MKRIPGICCHNGYFYFNNPREILSGFYLENTRHGAYVWKYILPLFDPASAMHLTYSLRLEGAAGYIDTIGLSKQIIAEKFCAIVEPIQVELQSLKAHNDFQNYIERNDDFLMNPLVRGVYGITLLLSDNIKEAIDELQLCLNSTNKGHNPEEYSFFENVLDNIEEDSMNAKKEIFKFVQNKKASFTK